MKKLVLVLACVFSIVASKELHAAPVTFSFNMIVFGQDPPPDIPGGFPAALAVGQPLSISVSFDSSALALSTLTHSGGGTRTSFDASSLGMGLTAGSLSQTGTTATVGFGQILVRDNYPDPVFGDLVDGMSFTLRDIHDPNVVSQFSVILRGPTLDLINAPNLLPTSQDPRWASQRTAVFNLCRSKPSSDPGACDLGFVGASTVPEPTSAALVVAGLLAMGLRRDRHPGISGPDGRARRRGG